MNPLLQATQPSGMSSWSVAEWTLFFGAVTALVGVVTSSIITVLKSSRAEAIANAASAANVETRKDIRSLNEQVTDVAKSMPTTPEKPGTSAGT